MKVLLLQISDIHIKYEYDSVLNRGHRLMAAVRNVEHELDACILTVTGDIGFSGTEEEYMLGLSFLETLLSGLREQLPSTVRVEIVVIPGNHDCNFKAGGQARDIILDKIISTQPIVIDDSLVALCTETQNNFFSLQELIAGDGLNLHNRLYWEYKFAFNNETILFRCCNTAWLSTLRESAGQLYYPVSELKNQEEEVAIAVTLFHHPYNWLGPNNARAFRNRVEELSDIILTGHEHSATARVQRGSRGEVNLYIEGGALQENNDSTISEFNVILIDTKLKKQKLIPYYWEGNIYTPISATSADWEEYHVNRLRTAGELDVKPEMRARLDDLGLSVNHPSGRPLIRSDIFIYPDLREAVSYIQEVPKMIRGEAFLDLTSEFNRVLITGGNESGKTTLSKQLFEDYRAKGFVPILLNGVDAKRYTEDKARDNFAKVFVEQYKGMSGEEYKQLERSRKVLIIDDIHKCQIGKAALYKALEQMSAFAGQVVIFSHDIFLQFGELSGNSPILEGDVSFPQYKIQPLGHLRRNEIAEKWFSLDDDLRLDQAALARKAIEAKNVMDTAIGKNFVPSYPVMIISILQAIQHSQKIDVSASTYGYFYDLLIRRALADGSTHESFDVKLGYLSFLASEFYRLRIDEIDEQQLREIHKRFEEKKLLPVRFNLLLGSLLKANILEESKDVFKFKYPYIYYYFVALYLKDNISLKSTREQITALTRQVHTEESANILLFLAHLTKDSYVIEQMLVAAKKEFEEFDRAEILAGQFAISELDATSVNSEYVEAHPDNSRKSRLKALDTVENELSQEDDVLDDDDAKRERLDEEFAEGQAYVTRVASAFRTLQILGQLLKNFVGSMDGEDKVKIADECIGIGLRTLDSMYSEIRNNGPQFIDDIKKVLLDERENRSMTQLELQAKAVESLFGMVFISSYAVIKIISNSIGSAKLGLVYEKLLTGKKSPALGSIHASLSLEHDGTFPEDEVTALNKEMQGNVLAQSILRSLVINHFHLFEVRFDIKQRVCQSLNIAYRAGVGSNPHRRLLSGKR